MKRVVRVVLVPLIILACQDVPVPTGVGPPQLEIVDAVHGSGNEHFFFLPPMVPAPTPGGVFDATRSPTVEICVVDEAANECPAKQPPDFPILFTMDAGLGSETVRVSTEDEHYIVNWHTNQFELNSGATYRIRVLEPGPLGHADVVVGSNKELKNGGTGQFIALTNGRTLPIKFRIEEGLPFVVDENGGMISAAGGDVLVDIPPDAVSGGEEVPITVDEVPPEDETLPAGTDVLPGTVFDFGPEGTEFAEPVGITVAYDPAIVPAGIREEGLRLFTLVEGRWQLLLNGSVDTEAKTVTGFTDHFSTFGTLSISVFCSTVFDGMTSFETFADAFDAVIPGGTIEVCDGTHVVEGAVIDAPVTIQPQAGAAPVIQNNSDSASFWVDGVLMGTVQFQNLAFDNQSPATRSYSIRPRGTYDQVIVDNSTFSVSPPGSGGIRGGASTVPGSRITVLNSSFTGGAFAVLANGAVLDVSNSTFIDQTNRAAQYQFAASGVFQGNTMTNCGGVACIRPFQSDITVIGNTITGVGQSTALFSSSSNVVFTDNLVSGDFTFSVVQMQNGSTGLVERNTISGCGPAGCIRLFTGAVDVIDNTVTNDVSRPVGFGIFASGGPFTISGNDVIGTGVIADPNEASSYAYDVAGIRIQGGTATLTGNDVSNAAVGLLAAGDAQILTGSEDNTIDEVLIGVSLPDNPQVLFHRNDVTGYVIPMEGGGLAPGSLTCNWWGNPAGPQGVDPGIPAIVYTPFADTPIAGVGAVTCDPSAGLPTVVRVSDTPDGGIVTVLTLQQAMVTVAPGGTILIADGTHVVQDVQVNKPVTIEAEGPGVPEINASGAFGSLTIGDVTGSGAVTIRGLQFVGANNHDIEIHGQFDQILIENSEFHPTTVDQFGSGITINGAQGNSLIMQNNAFIGGNVGVNFGNPNGFLLLNNTFTGQARQAIRIGGGSGRAEGNTISECGDEGCIVWIPGDAIELVGNQISVDLSRPVNTAISVADFQTALIENNQILGSGGALDFNDITTFPIQEAGITVSSGGTATVSGNRITNAFKGLNLDPGTAVTGRDNIVENAGTAIVAHGPGLSIRFSDLVGYTFPLGGGGHDAQAFTCNWWGSVLGPVNIQGGISPDVFTPWATAPVAGTSATTCSGSPP